MSSASTNRRLLALVGLLFAATACAAAPPAKPTGALAETVAKTPVEELVCRDRLRPGSRIAMRTCATAKEWAAAAISGVSHPQPGLGPWGQAATSTVGQSVGPSAFTPSGGSYSF